MPPVINGSSISLAPIIEEEDVESREAGLVMKKLKSVLYRGVERYLTCENVILPRNTLRRAALDILDLSSRHSSGLRGTLIDLYLEDNGKSKRLAQVVADPRRTPKTIIELTLYRDAASDDRTLQLHSSYAIKRLCKP
ncbi:DNA damage-inducible transcript 4-like protein [Macrobrachium rosenbergii]|uniref:DNA damage-inducible transcript 4-like protein n=1 Tax=Macrobrachium rosenbergii TaxID=79674 RepID=UPI0034D4F543